MVNRLSRLNQLIKKELSEIIFKEIDFPQAVLVTVMRVAINKELKEANVWISTIPEKDSQRVLKILNKNISFFHQRLGKRLKIRMIPKIKFLEEKKIQEFIKIEELLEKISH